MAEISCTQNKKILSQNILLVIRATLQIHSHPTFKGLNILYRHLPTVQENTQFS